MAAAPARSDPAAAALAEALRARGFAGARIAIVLGSGLGALAESVRDARRVAYADLPGMPQSRVPGHAGELVLGTLAGAPGERVLLQSGRVHLYEGWSAREVTRAVRAYAQLRVRVLLLANAAGGLVRAWPPGTLMRIRDHLNLQGETPLARAEGRAHCAAVWDAELWRALERAARASGVALESGVYAALPGPAYETPAEIRMLRAIGADAVGMSTVLEAVAAHASGLRVAGISCITNHAAGIAEHRLSHAEVVAEGKRAAGRFCALAAAAVAEIAAEP
jgi:purine-nucleoside phosphorylase